MNNTSKITLRHRSGNCHYYDSWKDLYQYVDRAWIRNNVPEYGLIQRPRWGYSDYATQEGYVAWSKYQCQLQEYERHWVVEDSKGNLCSKNHVLAQAPEHKPWRPRWRRSKVGRRFKYPKVMPTRKSDIELVELEKEYEMRIARSRAPYPDPWDDTYERLQRSWKVHRKQQWKDK